MKNVNQYRGRIAPSPSGYLHIGHLSTFRKAAERARERGGKLILRMEDIDFERCKRKYADAIIADLKLSNISWDEGDDVGGDFAPYTQSLRIDYYKKILRKLFDGGFIYPCAASRAQIKEASLPPLRTFDFCDAEAIFPPSLRGECPAKFPQNAFELTWRFKVPSAEKISFIDNSYGKTEFVCGGDFGDFAVWRKLGAPTYELAVVADDIAMQITEVVRGADLLLSTARQLLLYRALEIEPPEFFHCKLIRDSNGEKISKSTMKCFDAETQLANPARLKNSI